MRERAGASEGASDGESYVIVWDIWHHQRIVYVRAGHEGKDTLLRASVPKWGDPTRTVTKGMRQRRVWQLKANRRGSKGGHTRIARIVCGVGDAPEPYDLEDELNMNYRRNIGGVRPLCATPAWFDTLRHTGMV